MIVDILGQISNNKFDSLKQEKQYIEGGPINYVVKQSDLDPVKVVEKPWFFVSLGLIMLYGNV